MRKPTRRRNEGAASGADAIPQETRVAHLHDPEPDCAPPFDGKAGRGGAGREIADGLRRLRSASLPIETRWRASPGFGEGDNLEVARHFGHRPHRSSYRPRPRLTALRPR